jgi:hypothetical protein
MSLERAAAWGTIVCAVCAPLAVLFGAAAFFGWTPQTFRGLSVFSQPVGLAIIVVLLVVFPWTALVIVHRAVPASNRATPHQISQTSPLVQEVKAPGDRIFVDVMPEDLIKLFKDHMDLQAQMLVEPFMGKWIRISAVVKDILKNRDASCRVTLNGTGFLELINLNFPPNWVDRISVLQRGQVINACGQITKVTSLSVELEQCELLNTGGG